MSQNTVLQSPSALFGATISMPDGTTSVIGPTGRITVASSFVPELLSAGFSLPSNVAATQYTSISSGNGTLTGAQCAGAPMTTLATSGATALTTPTAAQLLAAIPNGQVGSTYRLRIVNTNGGTLTITADASVTATGTLTLATNTWREWDVTIVTATTATMKTVGVGTIS